MTRAEYTGDLVVELRADPGVIGAFAALGVDVTTADGRKHIAGGEARTDAPHVVVRRLVSAPWPGPRSGLSLARYALACTAEKGDNGDVQATSLAGAVVEALHLQGWRRRTVALGDRVIAQTLEESTGPPIPDPDTGDPTVTVQVSLKASTQVLT